MVDVLVSSTPTPRAAPPNNPGGGPEANGWEDTGTQPQPRRPLNQLGKPPQQRSGNTAVAAAGLEDGPAICSRTDKHTGR